MEGRESVCKKWLTDALSYETLAAFEDKALMLSLLKSATRKIMQIAKHVGVCTALSDGSVEEATDFYSRILLVIISVRVCTGLDKQFQYYVNEDQHALETLLEILEAHTSLFESNAEVYHSMWFATFKELLFKCKQLQSKNQTTVFNQFKSKLSQEECKKCLEVIGGQSNGNYVSYADFMFEQLAFLNSKIRKPFLIQIKSRLGPSATSQSSSDLENKFAEHKNKINSCIKKWASATDQSSSSVKDTNHFKQSTRKPQVDSEEIDLDVSRVWSVKLDSYILFGVYKLGVGKWSAIRRQYPFPEGRTNVNIKDRWRTMVNKKLVQIDSKNRVKKIHRYFQDYITTENDNGILKLHHCLEKKSVPVQSKLVVHENEMLPTIDLVDCFSQPTTSERNQHLESPGIRRTQKRKIKPSSKAKTAKKHFRKIFFDEDDSS